MDYRHHQHCTPGRHCYYPFYISQLWKLRLKVHSGQSEAETTCSVQGPYWTTGEPASHRCWTAPPVSRPRGRSPARSLRKAPGHSVISPFEDQESRNTGPAFTEELRAQGRNDRSPPPPYRGALLSAVRDRPSQQSTQHPERGASPSQHCPQSWCFRAVSTEVEL